MNSGSIIGSEFVNSLVEIAKTFCGRLCGGNCGILVTVDHGKITKVEGDPDCPLNKGHICPKGRAIPEILYHPDRITYPLRRVGKRGEGKWERISVTEALGTIAQRIKECIELHGGESILLFTGAFRGLERVFVQRFASILGTPNTVGIDNICHAPRTMASSYTFGDRPFPDFDHSPRCIMVWGRNSLQTGAEGSPAQFNQALKAGAKLIVIDPRKISLVSRADLWIKPRPGSDGLLALGMINFIIREGLYDKDFVQRWTLGFDKLEEFVKQYPLDMVAERTWVPRSQIEQAAKIYAASKPAIIQWGNALDQTSNAFQTCRALSILKAITGNIDVSGGNIFLTYPPILKATEFSLIKDSLRIRKTPVGSRFKVAAQANIVACQEASRAIIREDPYQLKAGFVFGSNPMLTHPNAVMVHEALKKLDFLIVVDLFMTPTAALSDVILPVAANLEFNEFFQRSGYIAARPKLVEPPGECKSDLQWINLMAKSMGFGEHFWNDETEAIDTLLKPTGLTFEQLKSLGLYGIESGYRKYEREGFRTPSGKVELYSSKLKELGLEPLPVYNEPKETPFGSPEIAEEYPLILTNYKSPFFYHASHRNIPSLRKLSPEPTVELNPVTATKLGLEEADMVYIESIRGRIKQRLKLNQDIDPRVVMAAYGWWFPEEGYDRLFEWEEANLNVLTSNEPPYDPAMGSVNLRGILCRVYKAS